MAPSKDRRLCAWALGVGTLLGGCAGLTSPRAERVALLESTLSPHEAAWAASRILAEEVPTPPALQSVPAPRRGQGYLLEARARAGGLYRFRAGGGFWGPSALSPSGEAESLLSDMAPLPLVDRAWIPAPGGPFPAFFERFLSLEIAPSGVDRTRIALSWADDEDRIGQAVERQLQRCLATLEPLALGNRLLGQGDPVAALAAYDRALAGGDPPGSAFQARLLGRVHFHRGLALVRVGALENGWDAFEAAARLDPSLTRAQEFAACMTVRTGRTATARALPASAAGTDREKLLARAEALLVGGRPLEARRLFMIARSEPALALQALTGLAETAIRMGDLKSARDHLLHGLARSPGNPELLAALEAVEERRGAYGQALHLAVLQGRSAERLASSLAPLPACEGAARLTLIGGPRPTDFPGGPLGRVLASLATGRALHLSNLRQPAGTLPATPPF